LGTVGGVVQLYDSQGNLIWQRRLPGEAQGHNALDMTPDGSLIVVGTNGSAGNDGFVSLLGADGGVLWQQQFQDGRDLGTIPAPVDFDHNHRGAISVSLSDDGRYIVAGFGDSAIRIFEYTQ
jgi:outer membrane protein assembly factor BamB